MSLTYFYILGERLIDQSKKYRHPCVSSALKSTEYIDLIKWRRVPNQDKRKNSEFSEVSEDYDGTVIVRKPLFSVDYLSVDNKTYIINRSKLYRTIQEDSDWSFMPNEMEIVPIFQYDYPHSLVHRKNHLLVQLKVQRQTTE
ncbi:hypothetical protein ACTXT7_005722 [Hymenolepis weldensis]